MTDEGWVCPRDKLPNMGQNVDIELLNGDVISGYFDYRHYGALGFYKNNSSLVRFMRIKYWREKQEKRPDFGRLKKGDLLLIDSTDASEYPDHTYDYKYIGFFRLTSSDDLYINPEEDGSEMEIKIHKTDIYKITRINLEKQTFEEI